LVFEPLQFLEVASRILKDRNYEEEPRWRTAISRAYYAAFLTVKKRLEEWGYSFADVHRLHRDVIDGAMKRDSTMGNKLETLFNHRVDADYMVQAFIPPELAKNCTRLSELIIKRIEETKAKQ